MEAGPRIHHVERYHRTPTDLNPYFNYEEACRLGETMNEDYVASWNTTYVGAGGESFTYDAYRIRALPGDKLPFNRHSSFEDTHPLDLVVAEKGCTDVRKIMNNFDLPICAATWDGRNFRITHPHLTFNRQSCMEPGRRELMRKYMQFYKEASPSCDALSAVRRIREAVSRLSEERAYRDVFKDHQNTRVLPRLGNIRVGQVQCHNVLCVLFERLKKYKARGIDIIDAPAGATEFKITNRSLCDDLIFGGFGCIDPIGT